MTLQWTFVAGIFYGEIALTLILLLPWIRPSTWSKLFRSRLVTAITSFGQMYTIAAFGILFLLFADATREVKKYSNMEGPVAQTADTDAVLHMRLFRSQRNFYISGFALLLFLVISRIVTLLSRAAQTDRDTLKKQCENLQKEYNRIADLLEAHQNGGNDIQKDNQAVTTIAPFTLPTLPSLPTFPSLLALPTIAPFSPPTAPSVIMTWQLPFVMRFPVIEEMQAAMSNGLNNATKNLSNIGKENQDKLNSLVRGNQDSLDNIAKGNQDIVKGVQEKLDSIAKSNQEALENMLKGSHVNVAAIDKLAQDAINKVLPTTAGGTETITNAFTTVKPIVPIQVNEPTLPSALQVPQSTIERNNSTDDSAPILPEAPDVEQKIEKYPMFAAPSLNAAKAIIARLPRLDRPPEPFVVYPARIEDLGKLRNGESMNSTLALANMQRAKSDRADRYYREEEIAASEAVQQPPAAESDRSVLQPEPAAAEARPAAAIAGSLRHYPTSRKSSRASITSIEKAFNNLKKQHIYKAKNR